MTYPKKELAVACSYLLRLIKPHIALSPEQIRIFKRTFHDVLSKRYIGHWFPATPHRGSAYRCLQTKHWKDPVLRSIAERSSLPLHRYLPSIFTMWIDPGEVAICFGDEGTWCPLYKHDINGAIQQHYSDEEDSTYNLVADEDLSNVTENIQTLTIENNQQHHHHPSISQTTDSRSSSSLASSSRASSPFSTAMAHQLQTMNDWNYVRLNDCNGQGNQFWSQQQQQQQLIMSDALFQEANF